VYRADRIVGVVLVLLGAGAWALTTRFPMGGGLVEPSSLPRLIAAVLIMLGGALAWKAHRAVESGQARQLGPHPGFAPRVVAALAGIALFIFLLESVPGLGFPLLAPPLMILLGRVFGGRSWLAIAVVSVAVTEGAYFFFHGWLGLVLPPSAWF
jgi:hypothetical protein